MERLKWYLKQLLPFTYVTTFTENDQRRLCVWRMWLGRCFSVSTYNLAARAKQAMREKLAAIIHGQWSGWMEYLFQKGTFNRDGTWTMPAWAVGRWTRQMKTSYDDLSEEEKESDRQEADVFLQFWEVEQKQALKSFLSRF